MDAKNTYHAEEKGHRLSRPERRGLRPPWGHPFSWTGIKEIKVLLNRVTAQPAQESSYALTDLSAAPRKFAFNAGKNGGPVSENLRPARCLLRRRRNGLVLANFGGGERRIS